MGRSFISTHQDANEPQRLQGMAQDAGAHECPRSACVFCPFKSAAEWLLTKANPNEWARAVEVDRGLRWAESPVNRGIEKSLYLHRQCIPLEMVDLEAQAEK